MLAEDEGEIEDLEINLVRLSCQFLPERHHLLPEQLHPPFCRLQGGYTRTSHSPSHPLTPTPTQSVLARCAACLAETLEAREEGNAGRDRRRDRSRAQQGGSEARNAAGPPWGPGGAGRQTRSRWQAWRGWLGTLGGVAVARWLLRLARTVARVSARLRWCSESVRRSTTAARPCSSRSRSCAPRGSPRHQLSSTLYVEDRHFCIMLSATHCKTLWIPVCSVADSTGRRPAVYSCDRVVVRVDCLASDNRGGRGARGLTSDRAAKSWSRALSASASAVMRLAVAALSLSLSLALSLSSACNHQSPPQGGRQSPSIKSGVVNRVTSQPLTLHQSPNHPAEGGLDGRVCWMQKVALAMLSRGRRGEHEHPARWAG